MRCSRDWSSDVCSSDLGALHEELHHEGAGHQEWQRRRERPDRNRSEERRVGKSVDLGGRRIIKKKKKKSIGSKRQKIIKNGRGIRSNEGKVSMRDGVRV